MLTAIRVLLIGGMAAVVAAAFRTYLGDQAQCWRYAHPDAPKLTLRFWLKALDPRDTWVLWCFVLFVIGLYSGWFSEAE